MIASRSTPDLALLWWIAFIKLMNPKFIYISEMNNAVADILSRARYNDEEAMVDDDEDVDSNFYSVALA